MSKIVIHLGYRTGCHLQANRTCSFYKTKNPLAEQGTRAMYSLLARSRNMRLPIDLQLDLFKKLVNQLFYMGVKSGELVTSTYLNEYSLSS